MKTKDNKQLKENELEDVNGGDDQARNEYDINWHLISNGAQWKAILESNPQLINWQDNEK